jgi:signal transduction histidine kinase
MASILAVAILAVVLFAVPLAIVVQRFVDEQASLRLERQAVLTSRQIPGDFAAKPDPVELPTGGDVTFGLYDPHGNLVAGRGPRQADPLVAAASRNQVRQGEVGESRVAAIPIVESEVVVGALRASQPTAASDRRVDQAVLLLSALAVAVLAIGAILARFVAGRLARPVNDLRDQAVRLGQGDFAVVSTPSGVPELDDASEALVATASRLDELIRRERAFSADASHQLRTPLAALRSNIETEIQFPRPSPTAVLTEALEDIAHLEATIDQLLTFARSSSVRVATTELNTVLAGVQSRWNGPLADLGRPLVVSWLREPLTVSGSEGLLRQAFDTLLENAVVHGAGAVRIESRFTDESITVAITDHGQGFPPIDPKAAPNPDSTHGFGLALAERLLVACDGRLVIARRGTNPTIEVVLRRENAPGPA